MCHLACEVALDRIARAKGRPPGDSASAGSSAAGAGEPPVPTHVTMQDLNQARRIFTDSPVAMLVASLPPRLRLALVGVAVTCKSLGHDMVCLSEVQAWTERALRAKGLATSVLAEDAASIGAVYGISSGRMTAKHAAASPGAVAVVADSSGSDLGADVIPVGTLCEGLSAADVREIEAVCSASPTPHLPPAFAAVASAMWQHVSRAGMSETISPSLPPTIPPRNAYWPCPLMPEWRSLLADLHRHGFVLVSPHPAKLFPSVQLAISMQDLTMGLERVADTAGIKLLG